MDKKELRIGNYINNYNKVIGIGEYILCEALSFGGLIFIEDPKPIPLTEEILLKCGFEKHNKEFWFKDFFIGLIDNSFNLKEGIGVYVADVYYLHQLQNLYFALTNEELTVNL